MTKINSYLIEPSLIRLKEMQPMIGLARSTIYDKMNPKSKRYDASFPKPLKIGLSAIAWRLTEIQAWIDSRSVGFTSYEN